MNLKDRNPRMLKMKPPPNIVVQPFQPKYQSDVKDLILAGLTEHWGTLDPGKNPDLNDIELSYSTGLFLVAMQDNKIIGTGAIVPISEKLAEIVRMSVLPQMRRTGVGKLILVRLCDYARLNGYERIILETTETWHEAIEFYKNFGFQITHHRGGDVYFSLDL
jgi:GNAT superfamily N-acetyltransferase